MRHYGHESIPGLDPDAEILLNMNNGLPLTLHSFLICAGYVQQMNCLQFYATITCLPSHKRSAQMKNMGMVLLAVWLIATGLKSVIHLSFQYDSLIFGAIAIIAGVLIILRR